VKVGALDDGIWTALRRESVGQLESLNDLLAGEFPKALREVFFAQGTGLFPQPAQIEFSCSCPDWAVMCKHVAAVLYGVGARLDESPELLFLLRGVDHGELILPEESVACVTGKTKGRSRRIADETLEDVFGIELSPEEEAAAGETPRARAGKAGAPAKRGGKPAPRKAAKKAKTAAKAKNGRTPPQGRKPPAANGKTVAKLRAKFGMSKRQFADLLSVSAASVAAWERKPGPLNLKPHTLEAWNAARVLTKREAWSVLEDA
jgi:DNA-binding transcriptional regulator YiaG